MSELNSEPEQDEPLRVPTIQEERHFLEQCEYVNRSLTAIGRLIRGLLRQRGWRSEWCQVDEEVVWSKTFADGTTQHLDEDGAYRYEVEQTRQFFRNARIAMKPRRHHKPPPGDD